MKTMNPDLDSEKQDDSKTHAWAKEHKNQTLARAASKMQNFTKTFLTLLLHLP